MSSTCPEPDPGLVPSAAGVVVGQALDAVVAGLDGFAGVGLVGLSDGEVLRLLARVHALVDRVDGLALSVVHEADVREVAQAAGASSTRAWLVHACRLRPSTAGRRVRLARALHSAHPEVRGAVVAGAVSVDHAEVIRAALTGLPATVSPVVVADAEQVLLGHATSMDPQRLGAAARHLGVVLDPDGAAAFARQEERLRPRCGLHATDTGHGYVRLTGAATVEQWAWLSAGIDPLAAPVTTTDAEGATGGATGGADAAGAGGVLDPRPLAERRLDALVELVRIALESPQVGEHGGTRPQIVVTVPLATLQDNPHLTSVQDLPHLDLDLPSASPAGVPISPTTARRLACDAAIIPAVLGTRSEPLDLGRVTYTAPRALRRAVTLRDKHCRFPGCRRRPRRCHTHHIHHWADGGETTLDNLCLLCDYHHHVIHQPNSWQIRATPTGPQFIAPQWIRGP